jgi:hypothetical protein
VACFLTAFSPNHQISCGMLVQDGDLSKVTYLEPWMGYETFTPIGRRGGGAPVSGEFMPTRFRWDGPRRKIADYSDTNGILLVSEGFKRIIEQFEPGQHQFFPAELQWKNGDIAGHYFVFFHSRTLKSVDPVKTTIPRLNSSNPDSNWALNDIGDARLVISTKIILGWHIWKDANLVSGPIISDALAEVLIKNKLSGFLLTKITQSE